MEEVSGTSASCLRGRENSQTIVDAEGHATGTNDQGYEKSNVRTI